MKKFLFFLLILFTFIKIEVFAQSTEPNADNNLVKYDDKGNKIHEKELDGSEAWFEYNYNGNIIHKRHTNGLEKWWDDNGLLIHEKDKYGNEKWYDNQGNVEPMKFFL